MSPNNEVVAVIPCLNEARHIDSVVRGIREFLPRVVVVDDGSTDDTQRVAERAGATVLRNPYSMGKGAALRAGWQWALGSGAQWILNLDGDGQHAPDDVPGFLQAAQGADLIVGNRFQNQTQIPWVRRWTNRWMSARLSSLTGQDLPDTQCGYRMIRADLVRAIDFSTSGYEIESEILVRAAAEGFRIRFVPVQVIYEGERSDIRPVRDSIRWFRWYFRTASEWGSRRGMGHPSRMRAGVSRIS